MSFDKIFDLTAAVYFHFYNIMNPKYTYCRELMLLDVPLWHYMQMMLHTGTTAIVQNILNPFTTGNPFLGTKLLGFSIGRGSGAMKGLSKVRRAAPGLD